MTFRKNRMSRPRLPSQVPGDAGVLSGDGIAVLMTAVELNIVGLPKLVRIEDIFPGIEAIRDSGMVERLTAIPAYQSGPLETSHYCDLTATESSTIKAFGNTLLDNK
jgi:hypothetical protein